jgi:hypothetical protein
MAPAGDDGVDYPLLGQQAVRVNQAGALGQVRSVRRLGDTVRITGWAYDPDRPTARLALSVARDGLALAPHEITRLDAGVTAGGDSHAGAFDLVISDLPGTHSYTVYAADPGSAGRTMIGGGDVSDDDSEGDETAVPSEVLV